MTAQNYPITEYYDTEQLLTELGIGEALVTVLDEKGKQVSCWSTIVWAVEFNLDPHFEFYRYLEPCPVLLCCAALHCVLTMCLSSYS